MSKQTAAAIETLSFEAALSELEKIVADLEKGNTALEDSIASYERGAALRSHCEKKLREAQAKIEKITVNDDGSVSAAPFGGQE
jgi:exodeoxyribonuclease VII small subunit